MDNSSIKSNIQNFRKRRKYTQEHVANMLGISVTAYRELEKGNTSIVNPNIFRMASLMNTTTEELVLGYCPTESEGQRLEEVQEEYVPRPAWQVWGARIALVVFILGLIMYYCNIFGAVR